MRVIWEKDKADSSIHFSGVMSSWDMARLMLSPEHRAALDRPIETASDFLALASMLFRLEEEQNPRELSIEAGSAALDEPAPLIEPAARE